MQSNDLPNRNRPSTFEDILGNDAAVGVLKTQAALPNEDRKRYIFLAGTSGCGKNTLAYVYANSVADPIDITEIDCAANNKTEDARYITSLMQYLPMAGGVKVLILNEVGKLSREAQEVFLHPLEFVPKHVIMILISSDPSRLKEDMLNRAIRLDVKPLGPRDGKKLLKRTCAAEGITLPTEAIEAILDASEGSSRQILSNLEKVAGAVAAGSEVEAALGLLTSIAEDDEDAKSLYNALVRGDWVPVVKGLKGKKDAEGIRRAVLAYSNAVYLNSRARDALNIMQVFASANLFDSGDAGLTVLCSGVDAVRGA